MPVFWWMRLDLVFLVAGPRLVVCFGGVCGLIMILGSLSANGWGCVPVLLVVSRYFLISSLISSVISWLFSNVLFSLHVFVFFTFFPL